jgi:hypothetical protein
VDEMLTLEQNESLTKLRGIPSSNNPWDLVGKPGADFGLDSNF